MPEINSEMMTNAKADLMQERKNQIESVWKDEADLLYPSLNDLDGTKTAEALLAPGFYDSMGRMYVEVAANACTSLMVGPKEDWLSFGVADEEVMRDKEAQMYFEDLRLALLRKLYKNNFYNVVPQMIKQGLVFSSVHLGVYNDPGETRINYTLWHPFDVWKRLDEYREVSEAMTRVKVPRSRIADHYDVFPRGFEEAAARNPNEKLWIYYYILKNTEINPLSAFDEGKPYLMVHFLEDGFILHQTGLNTLPGAFWNFEDHPHMDYGLGPGYETIRDMLQSNKIRKLQLKAAEDQANPPMWIPDSVEGSSSWLPGAENYHSIKDGALTPKPVFMSGDVSIGTQIRSEIDLILRHRFFYDFFMAIMSRQQRKTALEVAATQSELGAQIGPLVHTIERGVLEPVIRRTLIIMNENNELPEPPGNVASALGDIALEIDFLGPLSKAQRYLYKTAGAHKWLQDVLIPAAQMDPSVLDWFNQGEFMKMTTEGIGAGSRLIRTESEVEAIKAERLQQQMMAQAQQAAGEMIKQPAKPEEGSPAEAIMQQ